MKRIRGRLGVEIKMTTTGYEFFRAEAGGATHSVWERLADGLDAQSYDQGQVIYLQGSRATHFYYIVQGSVKTFLTSEEGGERILALYRTGDILGEAAFFDEQPRVSSAIALCRCSIISIDRAQTDRIFAQEPSLAMYMIKYLARTVRQLSTHVDDMAFFSAEQRIARLLLSLGGERGEEIECTHEFLGNAAGLSRVTVSRILGRMRAQGVITMGYRTIRVVDAEFLRQLIR